MNRAYSILDIKSVTEKDDERIIEGIASTPSADRAGDVVEPLGAKFSLPMPLLWQHDSRQPIGEVFFAKPTKNGIPFKAKIAKLDEPGTLKDRLDEAWQSIKIGLVKAVSIGFKSLEHSVMESGGLRFQEWEWLELSAVTIPANAEATITQIKAIDDELRAKHVAADTSSQSSSGPEREEKTAGSASRKPVKAERPKMSTSKKTIAEQISAFEATLAAKSARMDEIMDAAAEKGETLDDAAKEEYDGLALDVKEINEHISRLKVRQESNVAKAAPVEAKTAEEASQSRAGVQRVQVLPKKLPEGIGFTRYVKSLVLARGNIMQAHEIAKSNEQWKAETPDVETVLKAAVAAGNTTDTTWAAPLVQYQNLTREFIEYLWPMTIMGRIPGLRRVPFKVKIPRQTGTATVNWVGEAKVKPLSALAFDSVTLDHHKIAGIVVLTDELVRLSDPSAELIVRDNLTKSIVKFMDLEFIDPTNASTDVSPASITYGISALAPSGTTAAALRNDIKRLMATFLDSNLNPADCVWITTQQTALSISLMTNDLGQPEFPGITMMGGTLQGLPVIASENVPAAGGSPTDGYPLILAKASDILVADEGGVMIDASREAALQMDDSPDSPATASTTLVSLWQHNLTAIKAERMVTWKLARADAVGLIQGCNYTDS